MLLINHDLFPTLVGEFKEVLFPSQCDEIISYIDKSKFKEYGALTGDAVTNFSGEIKMQDFFPENLIEIVINKIQTCINQYTQKTGYSSLIITNTWISFQHPGSKLSEHTHPGSHVSGVLYLKVDKKSSPIFFSNPNPFVKFSEAKGTKYVNSHSKFNPEVGQMLIFPSWLSHGSGEIENMSEERIILSFNTSLSGEPKYE